jgi:hypothetical protein
VEEKGGQGEEKRLNVCGDPEVFNFGKHDGDDDDDPRERLLLHLLMGSGVD